MEGGCDEKRARWKKDSTGSGCGGRSVGSLCDIRRVWRKDGLMRAGFGGKRTWWGGGCDEKRA